jgi:hypothetical protein
MSTGINDPAKCRFCGMYHGPLCPTVKAFEYHPDGSLKRVEFKGAADYPQTELRVLPGMPTNTMKHV